MTRFAKRTSASLLVAAAALAATTLVTGCGALVVGTAIVGGAMIATEGGSCVF